MKILLFAEIAEMVGTSSVELPARKLTVREIKQAIAEASETGHGAEIGRMFYGRKPIVPSG